MATYAELLRDPRWQRRRLEIMQRDGWACAKCSTTTATLNVHHKAYLPGALPWQYPGANLVTLCEDCHHGEHVDDLPAPFEASAEEWAAYCARVRPPANTEAIAKMQKDLLAWRAKQTTGERNMIEFTSTMTIRAVGMRAKTKDGVTSRRIRLTIEREFDDDLASAIGADAKRVRKLLSDGALAKAEIRMDAIEAAMRLKNVESGRLRIDAVKGVRAVAKAPASVGGDMPPSIALLWDFAFADDVIVFLANSLGQTVSVEISPRQLELIKQETERSPLVRAAAAQAAGTLTRELVEEVRRYVEKRGEKVPVELRADLARFKLVDEAADKPEGERLANPVLTPEDAADLEVGDPREHAATPEDAEVIRAEQLAASARDTSKREHELYAETVIDQADEAMKLALTEDCETDSGPYVIASIKRDGTIMESEGDDKADALANLRVKLLADLAGGAPVAASAAAGDPSAPRVGLTVPKGAKAPRSHKAGPGAKP